MSQDLSSFEQAKAGQELFGQELQPFSPSRKVAAQTMGMLYPMIGEAGADQLERTGAYSGIVKDMSIVLWLCTLEDKVDRKSDEWTPSKALRKPDDALEKALEWAIEHDIVDLTSKATQDAMSVFMALVIPAVETEFDVQVEGGEKSSTEDVQDPKV